MPVNPAVARPTGIPPTISAPISAAMLGAVIGGANAFGRNLYLVQKGEMSLRQAVVHGLMQGAATSVATTGAALLTANLTDNNALHLTALAATAAGLSYLLTACVRPAGSRDAG
jgi:hypothetical protein